MDDAGASAAGVAGAGAAGLGDPAAGASGGGVAGAVSHIGLPQENGCATGILVDPATRKVLWAKNADKAVPIASMTKMMTLLLAEEAIAAGKVTRDTPIRVTVAAYKIGGSQVWLDPKETFPLRELIKTIAVKSANDSAYLVGEFLGGGSMAAFIEAMNARAKALGLPHTRFYDAHGLGTWRCSRSASWAIPRSCGWPPRAWTPSATAR